MRFKKHCDTYYSAKTGDSLWPTVMIYKYVDTRTGKPQHENWMCDMIRSDGRCHNISNKETACIKEIKAIARQRSMKEIEDDKIAGKKPVDAFGREY